MPAEFRNSSGYPALCFEHVNHHGERRTVVVARVTLKFDDVGAVSPCDPQPPLNFKEVPFEQVGRGPAECALHRESDLAPEKPLVDVIVQGTAYAPSERGARRFQVRLEIEEPLQGRAFGAASAAAFQAAGNWSLDVYGPSEWRWRHPLGRFWRGLVCAASLGLLRPSPWRRSWTIPVAAVPLRYSSARGGRLELRDGERSFVFCNEENPSGTGWLPSIAAIRAQTGLSWFGAWRQRGRLASQNPVVSAAQIWPAGAARPHRPDGAGDVGGWGAIAKPWLPRRRHAGTYDDAWQDGRRPLLPQDFDPRYWNGAHPDLQLSALSPDARLRLVGLLPPTVRADRTFQIDLPGLRFAACIREAGKPEQSRELRLDTVLVDVEAREVELLYRISLPLAGGVVALRRADLQSAASHAFHHAPDAHLPSKERIA